MVHPNLPDAKVDQQHQGQSPPWLDYSQAKHMTDLEIDSNKFARANRMPPLVVISLVDSIARRKHVGSQLREQGISFRFFDAERPAAFPPGYDASARHRRYSNDLTLGEIGAYNSHLRVWQDLVDSGDDVWCVLEDDVDLVPGFASGLCRAQETEVPWGILKVNCDIGSGARRVGSVPGVGQLMDYRKHPVGTQAYLIRREAAIVMLDYARRVVHPVDDMLIRSWEHGIRILTLTPPLTRHRNDVFGTTIHGRKKPSRTLLQKVTREFYMGLESINSHLDSWRRRCQDRRHSGRCDDQ